MFGSIHRLVICRAAKCRAVKVDVDVDVGDSFSGLHIVRLSNKRHAYKFMPSRIRIPVLTVRYDAFFVLMIFTFREERISAKLLA